MHRVEITLSEREYASLYLRSFLTRNTWFLIFCSVVLIGSYITLPWGILAGTESSALEIYKKMWGLLLLPILLVFSAIALYFSARARWRGIVGLKEPRTYFFHDQGIELHREGFSGHLTWDMFSSAERRRGWILLRFRRNPLDPFVAIRSETVEDLSGLCDLIEKKIDRSKGF